MGIGFLKEGVEILGLNFEVWAWGFEKEGWCWAFSGKEGRGDMKRVKSDIFSSFRFFSFSSSL